MRKAARTVKPNARTGERHTWKDRERRRKEERQRMAAEALIVEDAYQKGYADAMADMRKKKEQRRQREQAKKARRWYFIKQKACGLAMLEITVLAVWATEQARTYLGLDTVGVAEFFALLYIAYEVVSIFKNMALCGLPVKKVWEKVREFLAKYTDELPDTDELDGDSTTGNVEEHRTQERCKDGRNHRKGSIYHCGSESRTGCKRWLGTLEEWRRLD